MYCIDYNIDYIHILRLKHFLFTSLQQLTCSMSICIYVFFCVFFLFEKHICDLLSVVFWNMQYAAFSIFLRDRL